MHWKRGVAQKKRPLESAQRRKQRIGALVVVKHAPIVQRVRATWVALFRTRIRL
jgi:hypothetical protein